MAQVVQGIAVVHRDGLLREALANIARRVAPEGPVRSLPSLEALHRHLHFGTLRLLLLDDHFVRRDGCDFFHVRQRLYGTRIILFADRLVRRDVVSALVDGASGYVSQEMDAAEITGAMEIVWRGGAYIPPLPNPAPQLVAEDGARVVDDPRLTARQRDVLALMRMGKSNKEIARDLDIAESTVKVHVAAIFQILHVRNRLSAIIRSQPRIANGPAINLSA
jgi:DNA-binding NarL/FixJ family response regulator